MAKADIPSAMRLKPKGRKRDETMSSLGYNKLPRDDISSSGRIDLRKLDVLRTRTTIVKDPNLVIAVGTGTATALNLVVEYITTLKEILKEFKETPGDIAEKMLLAKWQ